MITRILVTAALLLVTYAAYKSYATINLSNGLDAKIRQGAIILDIRTAREYSAGHIAHSVNIPLSALHKDSIPLEKQKVIIPCCSHGLRSIKAVALLKQHGFMHVYNGGAWADLEQLVERRK